MTNNHVVADADRISVTFHDGTIVPGKVVGTDPDSDLAVLKMEVPAKQLKPVQVADSTQVKVGQLAIAIGNPFGLQGTMTVGFVSALGRLLPTESESPGASTYSIPDVIQTDVVSGLVWVVGPASKLLMQNWTSFATRIARSQSLISQREKSKTNIIELFACILFPKLADAF